ncbi:MAG: hypothetical protein N2V74_00360 [Candidatus Methanospirare jalkutatii]|nr:MAG: hypothetical protein N2V74_05495 [Candidatus Methanospirare jalkutatii]UYZ40188.1 MAG: hypothetical protein N2V74_00360 [Candidatus Methanospirare jalkutatii]
MRGDEKLKNEEEEEKEKMKKEIVSKIMEELELKGVSKRRLLEKLVEKLNYDEAKVRWTAKRAFITYRYAKMHEKGKE